MKLQVIRRAFILIFFIFSFVLVHTGIVSAQSAIECHCFKDRAYNPEARFAADEYILATSFNSLLANFFKISKKEIVMLKMKQGVGPDDLLVGLKVSRGMGADLNQLLGQRRGNLGWDEIIKKQGKQHIKQDPILASISTGIPLEVAGAAVADEMLSKFYGVAGSMIGELRTEGIHAKEMALVFILTHVSGQEPGKLIEYYKRAGKSWSEIAHGLGVAPGAAGKLILNYQPE